MIQFLTLLINTLALGYLTKFKTKSRNAGE